MSKDNNQRSAHKTPEGYHIPVLLMRRLKDCNIKPGGNYVDCTFGGGGHSREILKSLNEEGKFIAFDQDADARNNLPD